MFKKIQTLLGVEGEDLLNHQCKGVPRDTLHLPGPDFLDRVWVASDRPVGVLRSLAALFSHGRLAGTGYLSLCRWTRAWSIPPRRLFAPNPVYFDPENIVKLAIEGGCNGVASTLGVLGAVARKYAHKIPFIVKINHNELLTYPAMHDQTLFARVEQAFWMGAVAVGATVYFGSQESRRQLQEISQAFEKAHELGLATILWCYLRNPAFKSPGKDFHAAADLTGQANYLGVTIEADIVKQKQPTLNGGYTVLNFGHTNPRVYSELAGNHPIDMTRYQVMNCFMGRAGLINSGGSSGANDLAEAVRTAVINKRAGGTGMISGRKAFQRPMKEGVGLLNAIQDVYLCPEVTVA